jgi:hypothetical protein
MTIYTQALDILRIFPHARVMPRTPVGGFENFSVIIKINYLANRYFAKSLNNNDPAYKAFLPLPTKLLFLQ